jgi:hypothetical protein
MTDREFEEAGKYWERYDLKGVKMDPDQLWAAMLEYITAHNTCALATGSGSSVRCTPIEYSYHDGAFWMFSEGGKKFTGLEKNRKVSMAVFDVYAGFGKLKGMQISGEAEFPAPFSEEYVRAAEFRKIPIEALKKLEHPMILIKIIPDRVEYLNSDFKSQGFDSRQSMELPQPQGHAGSGKA